MHRPRVTVFGRDAYSGLDTKAAVLLESVVRNHALVDGNKRLGWLAVVVFYGLYDVVLDALVSARDVRLVAVVPEREIADLEARASHRLVDARVRWVSGIDDEKLHELGWG